MRTGLLKGADEGLDRTGAEALLTWRCEATDGGARTGVLSTSHGTVRTPAFMPVGTAATVKGLMTGQLREAGVSMLLGNTYHLMLRPGAERIRDFGGLRSFMNWSGPVLTDSGGYQIFSLKELSEVTEEGAVFRSHIDGSRHELTPERSVEIQEHLDSTITMVLDECTEHPASHERTHLSMERSMRWAKRCREAFRLREGYGIFGIVQGGVHDDLRIRSAEDLSSIGFDGYAVGGLSVGEGQEEMFRVLECVVPHLPSARPRYLMGVGRPDDIIGAVALGIDMFDCVLPTRSGRTGQAFIADGVLNIRNARHREDPGPLDAACRCPACRDHSRAYIHHLFRCGEMLGPVLLSLHNITYYQDLMGSIRKAIEEGRLSDLKQSQPRS